MHLSFILNKSLNKNLKKMPNFVLMKEEIILSTLKKYFGYTSFRPLQKEIVDCVLQGRDSLVLMPTGGGKSLCYQLPALLMPGITIVVSPLISLMKDQVDGLRNSGIPAAAINSSMLDMETNQIERECLEGKIKLLYLSPETALARKDFFLCDLKISLFAIDEAHCVSHWGHDFRPEYTQLNLLHESFHGVPMMALTATADKVTRKDILHQLDLHEPKIFISSFNRPNLSLSVLKEVKKKDKNQIVRAFINDHKNQSGIIYCLSRKTTEDLCNFLKFNGVAASSYHAGMNADLRTHVQDAFIKDRIQVVCATVAFGMGIDKSNVRWIIHYNLPSSIESFYQEIGRAGRDGLPADTILFYNYADYKQQGLFAAQSGQRDINEKRLRRMQQYAEANVCRRRILLNYFGEESTEDCHNCDVCNNPPKRFDGTVLAQKFLSAVVRTGEKEQLPVVVDVLMGSCTPEVLHKDYVHLKTFGVGRSLTRQAWREYALQFLHLGYIEMVYDENSRLQVTSLGKQVLYENKSVELSVPQENIFAKRKSVESKPQKEESLSLFAEEPEDKELFEALRFVRRRLADRDGQPPYLIFSDRTLHEMARVKPTSIEALGDISGVGDFKGDKYGNAFVNEIRKYKH